MPERHSTDVDVARVFRLGLGLVGVVAVVVLVTHLSLGILSERPVPGAARWPAEELQSAAEFQFATIAPDDKLFRLNKEEIVPCSSP